MMILRFASAFAGSRFFLLWFSERAEFGDGVFAMIVADLTELMQDEKFIIFRRLFVARSDAKKVLIFRFGTHKTP